MQKTIVYSMIDTKTNEIIKEAEFILKIDSSNRCYLINSNHESIEIPKKVAVKLYELSGKI